MSDFRPLAFGEEPSRPSGFHPLTPAGTEAARGEVRATVPEPAVPEESGESEEARRAFQAGYELGREEMASQVEQVAESLLKSLEELAQFRARLRERYERELLDLAVEVARKIVQHDVAEHPERWLGMIRTAVLRLVEREQIVVRVPPALGEYLRGTVAELRATLDGVKGLELVDDPSLPPGGCVVESRFGEVDLGIETQITATAEALAGSDE